MKFITKPPIEEQVHVIEPGNRFRIESEDFILARIDDQEYCLISLRDGNRWLGPGSLEKAAKELNKYNAILIKQTNHLLL